MREAVGRRAEKPRQTPAGSSPAPQDEGPLYRHPILSVIHPLVTQALLTSQSWLLLPFP